MINERNDSYLLMFVSNGYNDISVIFFCFAICMICIHSHALFAEKMGHSVVPCVPLRL